MISFPTLANRGHFINLLVCFAKLKLQLRLKKSWDNSNWTGLIVLSMTLTENKKGTTNSVILVMTRVKRNGGEPINVMIKDRKKTGNNKVIWFRRRNRNWSARVAPAVAPRAGPCPRRPRGAVWSPYPTGFPSPWRPLRCSFCYLSRNTTISRRCAKISHSCLDLF